MRRQNVILLFAFLLGVILSACGHDGNVGSSEVVPTDVPPSTQKDIVENTPAESATGRDDGTSLNIHTTNVVSPEFSLTDKFIVPVARQTVAPDGYIPISTAEDFLKIGLNPTGNYILTDNINLTGFDYDPIEEFSGIMDGNGYIVTKDDYKPIFSSVEDGGLVKNMGVYASNEYEYPMNATIAGIVGYLKDSEINNCFFDGKSKLTWNQPNKEAIEAQVQGEQLLISALVAPEIGGTISYAKSSVISNCYNSCSISSDYGSIGGIVYRAYESKISNCFNRGNIVSETGGVGGIVKQVAWESMSQSDDPVTIQECFNSGELCGDDDVSGIANGSIIPQTAITRCYNVGGLTANRCYGIGKAFRIDNCYNAGNLSGSFLYGIGYSEDDGNISFCYNIGLLTGVANIIEYGGGETTRTEEAKVGGICDDGASVSNCYYIDTTENATPEGALFANVNKLTDAEMQDADAFQGFDFSEVWKMGDSNYPYPVFRPFGQN